MGGNDNITNQIRRLRFENDQMTQQQLADLAGVTRQTIIAIEASKYAPSLPLAFKIARTFDKKLEDVFQFTAHRQVVILKSSAFVLSRPEPYRVLAKVDITPAHI